MWQLEALIFEAYERESYHVDKRWTFQLTTEEHQEYLETIPTSKLQTNWLKPSSTQPFYPLV